MKTIIFSALALLCIASSPILADNVADEASWQYKASCDDIEDALIEIESKIDALTDQITEDSSNIEEILSRVSIIETTLDGLVI